MSTITQEGLAPTSRKLGLGTRLAYGFGSIAYGVKNNGFDYFLLFSFVD